MLFLAKDYIKSWIWIIKCSLLINIIIFLHSRYFLLQKHEKKINMYIFKTYSAICEDFENYHFLKAPFHYHYTKLYRYDYFFLKLELQVFHLI
jgi:hypothetical protein